MAAVELCMWSAYTYNWIIDNKNINSQNPKKRLSDLVVIGYLMHNVILKLDLKSETKIYIFTEWFQNIGLAYAAENYTRITDFENISDSQFWKMDNFVGAMSNGVLNQICFKIVELEFGTNNLDLFNGNYAKFKKICHQNGLHLQSINNLSDFIIPNKYLTTSEKIAGEDYMKDIISDRMTEPIFKMLKIAKKEDPGLYVDILNAAKTLKYPDSEFPNRVHNFLKQHGIVKEIILWLKSEKKRILKEIKQIEKSFDLENIDIKESFDLWKEITVIMTNNKFIKQLKIDYELEI